MRHTRHTTGIAGRPGGVDWYFNLKDNIETHGPVGSW